jgi:protein-tyrosine phosphatase
MSRIVLFLCTGNYYRSRFAEILFNARAAERSLDWRATSRGLRIGWPGNIGPISPHTEKRLAELKLDWSHARHMPLLCRECDLQSASLVIALKEAEHRAMLAERFGAWADRVSYWHVHDVDAAHPEEALAEIEALVEAMLKDLANRNGSA